MNMNKILTITAIVLVAVIMGMSAVAPVVLQQAEARPGPSLSAEACQHLSTIPNPPPPILHLLGPEHCDLLIQ